MSESNNETTRPRLAHVTTSDITLRFLLMNQLMAYREAGFEVYGVSAPGKWVSDLQQAGICHIAMEHFTRGKSLFHDLAALLELRRALRAHRFDVVHLHNPKPGILGKVAARLARVPVVVNTIHGLYGMKTGPSGETVYSMKNPWLLMEASSMKLGHFDFSQNGEDLDWLRASGWLDSNRSARLGNGIDVELFSQARVDRCEVERLREVHGIPEGGPVIGMVGRLVWEKGYREYFQAAERLKARYPEAIFVSIGPRDDDKSDAIPEAVIEKYERAGVIRFFGMQAEMRELYGLMDVFVLPSHREGFPRSGMEAAGMGLPIVMTNIRGCREVVEDGVNGLLVPRGDARGLESAIERLIVERELRKEMGRESRRKAEIEFDEREVIRKTLTVYNRLLERKAAKRELRLVTDR